MVGFQSFNLYAGPCRGREERVELFRRLKDVVFGGLGEGGVGGGCGGGVSLGMRRA